MVRIRLRRMGAKKNAFYRIVVADQRSPRDGRFIEIIGTYNPHGTVVELKRDRVGYWLGEGAQPSDSVARLLVREKVVDEKGKFIGGDAPAEGTPEVAAEQAAA